MEQPVGSDHIIDRHPRLEQFANEVAHDPYLNSVLNRGLELTP